MKRQIRACQNLSQHSLGRGNDRGGPKFWEIYWEENYAGAKVERISLLVTFELERCTRRNWKKKQRGRNKMVQGEWCVNRRDSDQNATRRRKVL